MKLCFYWRTESYYKFSSRESNLFPNLKISLLIELENKVVDEKLTKEINKKIKKLLKKQLFLLKLAVPNNIS